MIMILKDKGMVTMELVKMELVKMEMVKMEMISTVYKIKMTKARKDSLIKEKMKTFEYGLL